MDILVVLEDREAESVHSGLDENTLKFELNGKIIPNSALKLTKTETEDDEPVLSKIEVSYTPSWSEVIIGSNTVKVDIDDKVSNKMNQISNTFSITRE